MRNTKCIVVRSHNSNITLGWRNQACNGNDEWRNACVHSKECHEFVRTCSLTISASMLKLFMLISFDFQKEASHKMSQNVTKPYPLPDLSIFVMPMLQFFSLPECCFDELQVGGRCDFGFRSVCNAIRKENIGSSVARL